MPGSGRCEGFRKIDAGGSQRKAEPMSSGIIAEDLHPVVIVGAGISGLSLAYRLERAGLPPLILDAAPRIAETWRRRHRQLRLNTHRHFSRLPGRSLPRAADTFADREAVIRYIDGYAQDLASPIRLGVRVSRIDRAGDRWHLQTSEGGMAAHQVVIATGHERVPRIPPWPGLDTYGGQFRHAADFDDAEAYRGRDILVIGAGNSGVDLLNHLVRIDTGALHVSVRTGTAIVPTWQMGFPVQRLSGLVELLPARLADTLLAFTEYSAFGDLRRHGLPRNPLGAVTRLRQEGVAPAIDNGFVAALKAGRVSVVPEVERFEPRRVVLAGGRALRPDTVLAATGYSPGLETLVGHLGVLDDKGVPCFNGPETRAEVPGLWFLGMKPRLAGNFQSACTDSRALARQIAEAERQNA